MTQVAIAKNDRLDIAENAIHNFKVDVMADLCKRFTELALTVRSRLITAEQDKMMKSLPKGFFEWKSPWNFSVKSIDGTEIEGGKLKISRLKTATYPYEGNFTYFRDIAKIAELPCPTCHNYNGFRITDQRLYGVALDLSQDISQWEQERNQLFNSVLDTVGAFKTVKALLTAWPEAEQLFGIDLKAKVKIANQPRFLPTVSRQALNDLIGLPKEKLAA